MGSVRVWVQDQTLDVASAIQEATGAEVGGLAVFVGVVRGTPSVPSNESKAVTALEYEAYLPLAEDRMRLVAEEAAERWDLEKVVAAHRTGRCPLGEPTVFVVCSAPHRAEALDACRWVIDEIKAKVPIWKKEIYADGSAWVGMEPRS